MCLIITGKSNKIRSTLVDTHGLLNDIYTSNPDGIGIMYATSKGLKIVKTLPKSLADAHSFITRLPDDDRELAIHFRWTTHGNTDMTNCHPYDVVTGYVAMMHNGVLHTGNKADTTKSDTWHFIKDYLSEAVHDCPSLVHNKGFLTMVADFIGDNRFVFMDGDGRMSHVNYDQGVEHDGMWFSNTYAWVPSRLIPNYYTSTKRAYKSYYPSVYGTGYDNYYYDDAYDEVEDWNKSYNITSKHKDIKSMATEGVEEQPYRYVPVHSAQWVDDDYAPDETEPNKIATQIYRILADCDADQMTDLLDFEPEQTLATLFEYFQPELNKYYKVEEATPIDKVIVQAVMDQDTDTLMDLSYSSTVGEIFCYYFDWTLRPEMESLV